MKKNRFTLFTAALIASAFALSSCGTDNAAQTTTTEQTTTTTTVATTTEPVVETPATPVAYHGEMIADGNRLIGSKTGEVVRVTGMSFFWSNWSQKYYNADYVDLMMDDFGCEVVRCSYGIQDDGVPYDRSCEPLIEDVIEAAIDRGLYVLIDWHSHGAHKNPDEAVAYFSQLAEKYGEYDNVIFEIYNEPMNVGWDDIKEYAEIVIPAIREHSDNLIIVGTPNWSQQVMDAANNPVVGDNIAYALHFYAGTHKQWLRDNADKAIAAGIPLFVTEWGSVNADGNGGVNDESTQEWFEWIDKNQLSSCNWAINDKNEGSSIFVKDSEYSETGNYIKALIDERTKDAAWRN
ncbi:MAG: glycoside hydrolase family 5 protein [Ruminiclostridium sp.]|nr:glycoside hydrolase family 5 protein [Ruminiclostridium sp.]